MKLRGRDDAEDRQDPDLTTAPLGSLPSTRSCDPISWAPHASRSPDRAIRRPPIGGASVRHLHRSVGGRCNKVTFEILLLSDKEFDGRPEKSDVQSRQE